MPNGYFPQGPEFPGGPPSDLPPPGGDGFTPDQEPPPDYGGTSETDHAAGNPDDRIDASPDIFREDHEIEAANNGTTDAEGKSGTADEAIPGDPEASAPYRTLSNGTELTSHPLDGGAELIILKWPAAPESGSTDYSSPAEDDENRYDNRDTGSEAPDNIVHLGSRSGHHKVDVHFAGDTTEEIRQMQAYVRSNLRALSRVPTTVSEFRQQELQNDLVNPLTSGLQRYQQTIGVEPTRTPLEITTVSQEDDNAIEARADSGVISGVGRDIFALNFIGENRAAIKDQIYLRNNAVAISEALANHALYSHEVLIAGQIDDEPDAQIQVSQAHHQHGVYVSDVVDGYRYQGLNKAITQSLAAAIRNRTIYSPAVFRRLLATEPTLVDDDFGRAAMRRVYDKITTDINNQRQSKQSEAGAWSLHYDAHGDLHRLAMSGDPHGELDQLLTDTYGETGLEIIRYWGGDRDANFVHAQLMALTGPPSGGGLPRRRPGTGSDDGLRPFSPRRPSSLGWLFGRDPRP